MSKHQILNACNGLTSSKGGLNMDVLQEVAVLVNVDPTGLDRSTLETAVLSACFRARQRGGAEGAPATMNTSEPPPPQPPPPRVPVGRPLPTRVLIGPRGITASRSVRDLTNTSEQRGETLVPVVGATPSVAMRFATRTLPVGTAAERQDARDAAREKARIDLAATVKAEKARTLGDIIMANTHSETSAGGESISDWYTPWEGKGEFGRLWIRSPRLPWPAMPDEVIVHMNTTQPGASASLTATYVTNYGSIFTRTYPPGGRPGTEVEDVGVIGTQRLTKQQVKLIRGCSFGLCAMSIIEATRLFNPNPIWVRPRGVTDTEAKPYLAV